MPECRGLVTLIDGGHEVADLCLAQRFDKIFYTGSPSVGRHVLTEAAKNLTPVALVPDRAFLNSDATISPLINF